MKDFGLGTSSQPPRDVLIFLNFFAAVQGTREHSSFPMLTRIRGKSYRPWTAFSGLNGTRAHAANPGDSWEVLFLQLLLLLL